MENTCVLHFLPVIPNWKVFNLPQKKHIDYFSILKQKREFQGLLEKALAKKYLKTGSCSILGKLLHFSVNAKNIDIIFLSEKNLLSLTLKIQERHALKRRNNILVFFKNISNDITYEIKNDNIYTRCEESIKWKIFYTLFEFLLLRYGTSIVGAVFYNYLFLEHLLLNEKMFLYLFRVESINTLKLNSKSNQSKSSIYSVTETFKSVDKNQTDLTFNSVHFDQNSCVPLSNLGPVSNSSKLSVKRKAIDDISSNFKLLKQDLTNGNKCLCFKNNCKCHITNWKVLRNIKTCSINSYMDILLKKGVLCDSEFSDSLNAIDSPQELLSLENVSFSSHHTDKKDECNVSSHHTNKKDECNVISEKQISEDSVKLEISNESQIEEQMSVAKNTEKDKAVDLKIDEVVKEQTNDYSFQKETLKRSGFEEAVKKEDISILFSEFIDEDITEDNGAFGMFTTAAGKKINISQTALKSVEKMFGDVFQSEETSDMEMETLGTSTIKPEFKSRLKTPAYKPPQGQRKPNIKADGDETIDGILAEKMFEEISFDEKEIENNSEVICNPSLSSAFASNVSEKIVTLGKVRKSLGGRRSLKPYSIPNV